MSEEPKKVPETEQELSAEALEQAAGGLTFTFKLVSVKTVSGAHDDESPKE